VSDSERTPPTAAVTTGVVAEVPAAPAPKPRRSRRRIALLLLLAFVLVGAAPMALVARVFGLWTPPALPVLTPLLSAVVRPAAPTPTLPPRDLAVPRQAWVAQATGVRAAADSGATVANLAPGFPVTLLASATSAAGRWDLVIWKGPTSATGGEGWVPDSALTAVGIDGPAVGDAGALAPALANALARLGGDAALAVYYPASQQLYLTNADHVYPLGDGARALVLTALLSTAPVSATQASAQALDNVATQVAQDNPAAAAYAYQQIGGAGGLSVYLASAGIAGIYPGSINWLQTQATPRALVQFYSLLAHTASADTTVAGLTAAVRTQVLAKLTPDAATSALAGLGDPLPAGATVTLVLGAALGSGGWSVTASEIVATGHGPTYIAAAGVRAQPSQESGVAAIRAIFAQLATIAET